MKGPEHVGRFAPTSGTLKPVAIGLVAAALVVMDASAAEAQPSAEVAVVSVAGAQASLEQADRLAARLLEHLPRAKVLPPDRVREELERGGGSQTLERAKRTADEARAELEAFEDLERTATLLNGAIEAYLHALPLLPSLDAPLRLLIDLATVELARDRSERVEEILEQAGRLDPILDLDPRELPPSLIRAAQEARERAGEQPLLGPRLVRRLGEELAVEFLLVVQPRPDPGTVRVEQYSAETGERVAQWEVEADELDTTAVQIGAAIFPGSVEPGPEPEGPESDDEFSPTQFDRDDTPEPPGPRRPWYRRWWIWTLVGLVVAGGAAVGIWYGVTATQSSDLEVEVFEHW